MARRKVLAERELVIPFFGDGRVGILSGDKSKLCDLSQLETRQVAGVYREWVVHGLCAKKKWTSHTK